MNENEAWDGADSANYDLSDPEAAYSHRWEHSGLSLPEECLWDDPED